MNKIFFIKKDLIVREYINRCRIKDIRIRAGDIQKYKISKILLKKNNKN